MAKQIRPWFLLVMILFLMPQHMRAHGRLQKIMAAWCAIVAVMRGADATSNWDKDSPPLQMAVTYFDGKECAVRCVGEADWLGPLVMRCYDDVGCDDMYLQGALECFVSPEVVERYGCTIVKTSNTTQ